MGDLKMMFYHALLMAKNFTSKTKASHLRYVKAAHLSSLESCEAASKW